MAHNDFTQIAPHSTIAAALDLARGDLKNHQIFFHRGIWYSPSEASLGSWEWRDLVWVQAYFKLKGFDYRKDGQGMSMVDKAIHQLKIWCSVDYAGLLAGYKAGYHLIGTKRCLVTEGPTLIEPLDVPFPTIDAILDDRFGKDQRTHFDYWLKWGEESLRNGPINGAFPKGHLLIMAGDVGTGKSLIQDRIITPVLGNRVALPEKYFKKDVFNGELVEGEHLKLEDITANTDPETRSLVTGQVKKIVACTNHRIEDKYVRAISVAPFWRCSWSVNDDPSSVRALPLMDKSMRDKVIILKVNNRSDDSPLPKNGWEQKPFEEAIQRELPGYVKYLHDLEIPKECLDPRFGPNPYLSPDILELIKEETPASELLYWIYTYSEEKTGLIWKGKDGKDLVAYLTYKVPNVIGRNPAVDKYLRSPNTLTKYLKDLTDSHPDQVRHKRNKYGCKWYEIYAPPQAAGDEAVM